MNIGFARAEMASALGRLVSLLPPRCTLPVLNYVLVSRAEDGESLRVEATDLNRHAQISVRLAEVCSAFNPVCLPLGTLLSVAKDYPGPSAKMAADGEMVAFCAGGSRVKMPTLPGDEFPTLLFEGDAFIAAGSGDAAALRLAFARVNHAIGTELTKPALLGVSFGVNGNGLTVVATNGHRLAKERVPGWDTQREPATIPTDGVRALVSFFPSAPRITLQASETRLRFSDEEGSVLTLPTLDNPFPNVEHIIPRDSTITVRTDRSALLAAVKRVRLVLRDNEIPSAAFTVSGDGIAIHAQSLDGIADEVVAADVTGADAGLRIGFNTTYVVDLLNSLSDDTVIAEMKHPERASIWRGENNDGMRLLMPLRLTF